MTRKPGDIVQINLRVRESERLKLEAAAREHGTSINAEMAARLANTFRQTVLFEANQVLENLSSLKPLLNGAHELGKNGDLMRAADGVIALIEPLLAARAIDGPAGAEIRAAIEKYTLAKNTIKNEAGKLALKTSAEVGAQS
jgi:Arc-like DNA binding domain